MRWSLNGAPQLSTFTTLVAAVCLLPCALSAPGCGMAPSSPTDMSGHAYDLTGACPSHDPAIAFDGEQYYMWATDAGNEAPLLRQWCSPEGRRWSLCGHILPQGLPSWARALAPTATNAWAPDVSYNAKRGLWQAYFAVSEYGKVCEWMGDGRPDFPPFPSPLPAHSTPPPPLACYHTTQHRKSAHLALRRRPH